MLDLMSTAFTQYEELDGGIGGKQSLGGSPTAVSCSSLESNCAKSSIESSCSIRMNTRQYRVPTGRPCGLCSSVRSRPGPAPDGRRAPTTCCSSDPGYAPNTIGLDWFYRRVYVPYLLREGVRMTVVGSVCEHVSFPEGHRVTKIPKVDGPLIDVYRRAKLVIVPLFEGTGMSIKTIESLAMGSVLVTTPVGARGLPSATEAVVQLDIPADPKGAAKSILALLAAPERRRALRMQARDAYMNSITIQTTIAHA